MASLVKTSFPSARGRSEPWPETVRAANRLAGDVRRRLRRRPLHTIAHYGTSPHRARVRDGTVAPRGSRLAAGCTSAHETAEVTDWPIDRGARAQKTHNGPYRPVRRVRFVCGRQK